MQTIAETHAPDYDRGDAFGVRHRFIGRDIVGQIVLVDAAERSQERPQSSASTFTTVAMDFAHTVAIIITRPFLDTMADTRMRSMHARIVGGLVRIQDRTLRRHIPFNNRACRRFVGMFQYPIADFVRRATDQTEDWWSVVCVGAFPLCLISAPAWRVG